MTAAKSGIAIEPPAVVYWHNSQQQKVAVLTQIGRKLAHFVHLDDTHGIVLSKEPLETRNPRTGRVQALRIRQAEHKGKPYPVERAIERYRLKAEVLGITKGAQSALSDAERVGSR